MSSVMHSLLRSLKPGISTELTDGQLLDRFVTAQSESAFAELMQRHGSMVFTVAHRLLNSATDAEDVYQVAFLLLARKAKSLRRERSLAGWLYALPGVFLQTFVNNNVEGYAPSPEALILVSCFLTF